MQQSTEFKRLPSKKMKMKEKMDELWRTYHLLIRKGFLVRRRHWKSILFIQILTPFLLLLLGMNTVNDIGHYSDYIENDTIYPPDNIIKIAEANESMFYSLMEYTHVHYFPTNELTYWIGNETQKCLHIPQSNIHNFDTKEEAMDHDLGTPLQLHLLALDLTNIKDIKQKNLSYTIMSVRATFDNISPSYLFDISGYAFFNDYTVYTLLHQCLDSSLITMFTQNSSKANLNFELLVQKMPLPPHLQMRTYVDYQVMALVGFVVLALTLVLSVEIGYTVKEKTMGTNFLMSINGLRTCKNLLSWHVSAVATSLLYVTLCSLAFAVSFHKRSYAEFVFQKNLFFLWLLLMIHVSHLIAFGIHIAAYFAKPFYATMIPCFINIVSFILDLSIDREGIIWRMPYIGFFCPSVFLYRGFQEVHTYESIGTTISFGNLFTTADEVKYTEYSIGGIMLLSIFGTIFHLLMAAEVCYVFPGKYGTTENPLTLFMRLKRKIFKNSEQQDFDYHKMGINDLEGSSKDTPVIQIRDLKKTYGTGYIRKKHVEALTGVSMDFYKGQITALLGHNGAGKSTMMNILSGLADATSGKVLINGKDVKFQKQEIFEDFGLCPQENLMFPELSVFEQLRFFGNLKATGKSHEDVDANVIELLHKLNLSEKKDFLPHQLSGGQQRRLCLGLALIGDANTIILDEPTSGMDPETKRNVWDLILKMRGRKTIVLTTHDMEEADILADRVAIISSGSLKCCDTPMALKKQYGHDHVEISFSIQPWCESKEVQKYFENKAEMVYFGNNKLVFSVPQVENLPDILDSLEKDKGDLGITGMSVSLITLNQVFFKVVDEKESTQDLKIENLYADKNTGSRLERQRVLAMLEKKLTYTKKNFKSFLFWLLLSVASIILIELIYSGSYSIYPDEFPLDLDLYRHPISMYSSNEPSLGKIYENVLKIFNVSAEHVENDDIVDVLLEIGKKDYSDLVTRCIASAAFNLTGDRLQAIALYQPQATFSLPISVNLLSNALLKYYGNDDGYSISISYENFPPKKMRVYDNRFRDVQTAGAGIVICIYLIIATTMFVVQPLRENSTKFKQVQRMTGLSAIIYWGMNFLFDFILMLISITSLMIGLSVINDTLDLQLFFSTELEILFTLCMMYTINVLAIIYMFSFLRSRIGTVITMLVAFPIGVGVVPLLFSSILEFSYETVLALSYIFRITPYMNFLHGLIALLENAETRAHCRFYKDDSSPSCRKAFSGYLLDPTRSDLFNDLPANLRWLLITPLFYFGLLFLVEFGIPSRLKARIFRQKRYGYIRDMEELVKKEKELVAREINARRYQSTRTVQQEPERTEPQDESWSNVLRSPSDESLFVAFELGKSYGNLHAVKEISFSVKNRECFGLLGVNGAGKSSTFKMLTGEEAPDDGCVYLGTANLEQHRKDYLAQLGYCPQSDPLIPSFNAYDHLKLFAALRGIKKSMIDGEVKKWIDRLNLTSCADQASKTYCGADKRRLSTAIALIGNPGLVLLDEPTNGLDPSAKRAMWKVLKACQAAGQSIILTSHSMEECEVLCDRLVIMIEGKLVCIGPSQQLKQRFGAGCNVQLKINVDRSEEDLWNIKNLVQSKLRCTLVDENLGFLSYHIIDPDITWKSMYDIMRDIKEKYECVNDFSVQSATLEELFIQFAKGSKKPVEV